MKKRVLFISLVLALLLATLSPVTAFAKEKQANFEADGEIVFISPGSSYQLGNSGMWRVIQREIYGNVSGDVNGGFVMVYDGIFALETQAGAFQGTMTVSDTDATYDFKVNGRTAPYEFKGEWYIEPGVHPDYPNGVPLLELSINGTWLLSRGSDGHGKFNAWFKFIPTADGHILGIVDSTFSMDGKWRTN